MLFADSGLSEGEISSLFVIWSLTSIVVEVPSGLWADLFSRRRLVALAPLVGGAGFALWTFFPSYGSFAAGFVLWGTGGAMSSGALQALVYEELARRGSADAYARVIGRAEALEPTAYMVATALAAPVVAVGGYTAVGIASVAVRVLQAAVGATFPESREPAAGDGPAETYLGILRSGLAEVRSEPAVRRLLVVLTFLSGFTALDEYLGLLAESTGVPEPMVAVLVLAVAAGETVGGWLAGRAPRLLAPGLAVAAVCLAAGAASRRPEGFLAIAAAFAVFRWAIAATEARLQDAITDRSRATVTSFAGLGSEALAVAVYAGFGLGATWAGLWLLMALAALPYLLVSALIRKR